MNRKLSAVKALKLVLLVLVVITVSACITPTRNELFSDIDRGAYRGDFEIALKQLEIEREELYTDRDGVLYHLDMGMLTHAAGEYQRSIRHFSEAEMLIEDYYTRSVSQAAASLLLNDTQLNYYGEDFEDIYLNVFNALNFIALGDNDSAFVEVRRIDQKLRLLDDKYNELAQGYSRSEHIGGAGIQAGTSQFHNSALARYISLVLHRSRYLDDGVRVDWGYLQQAFAAQGQLYPFPLPLDEKTVIRSNKPRLSVLAFAGRSPLKLANTLWINTYEDFVQIVAVSEQESVGRILDNYSILYFPGVEEGYRFKFELPSMVLRDTEVTGVRVKVDGSVVGELSLLEDMQRIAREAFQAKQQLIFLKTVTRAIAKGFASEAAVGALDKAGSASGSDFGAFMAALIGLITRSAVDLSEQADLRVSRFFPAQAYVGEWELPSGTYSVALEYLSGNRVIYTERFSEVHIAPGKPNLVWAFNPR